MGGVILPLDEALEFIANEGVCRDWMSGMPYAAGGGSTMPLRRLREMMNMYDDTRQQMGSLGRACTAHDFRGDGDLALMAQVYAFGLGRGDQPDFAQTT
jgi:hypothetical protein